MEALCERDDTGQHAALLELLQQCVDASYRLSDDLTARYFAHSGDGRLPRLNRVTLWPRASA